MAVPIIVEINRAQIIPTAETRATSPRKPARPVQQKLRATVHSLERFEVRITFNCLDYGR
jgi:hypothetical protein